MLPAVELTGQDYGNKLNLPIREGADCMRALKPSEETYRILYEDNPSMYFAVGADGVVLSVNRYGASNLGYEVGELLGSSVTGVFHPEDREAVQKQLLRLGS